MTVPYEQGGLNMIDCRCQTIAGGLGSNLIDFNKICTQYTMDICLVCTFKFFTNMCYLEHLNTSIFIYAGLEINRKQSFRLRGGYDIFFLYL